MSRRFVSQLSHQETVDAVFMASNKQLRPNRNGNLYLQVQLSDRSGSINMMLWNASERIYRGFEDGDYVKIEGTAQLYNGEMQLIANYINKANPDSVDEDDFLLVSSKQVDELTKKLSEILRSIKNPPLRNLVDVFLLDEDFMRRFTVAPAGIKNHHAFGGGLLQHVVNMLEVVQRIADLYPPVDPELLLVGVFLHDMGKIEELSYERGFSYTDEGQLVGHIVIAIGMLEKKIVEAERLSGEAMPQELVLRIKHMILSHHGSYEYGSPRLPMTPEAIALHHLDNLDAKIASFHQLISDDPSVDSAWTHYNPSMGRKLFKGHAQLAEKQNVEDDSPAE